MNEGSTRPWRHRLSEIDPSAKTAICAKCGPVGIRVKADGYRCRVADRERKRAFKKRHGEHAYKRKYTRKYQTLAIEQDGKCAICGCVPSGQQRNGGLLIDHDHQTGKTRGLLCHRCNIGLAWFEDNPGRLIAAAGYLKRHEEAPPPK